MDKTQVAKELARLARSLSVPEKHQEKIAIKTLKMPGPMLGVMGGMNKDEARDFLKSIGYSDSKIRKLEASARREAVAKGLVKLAKELVGARLNDKIVARWMKKNVSRLSNVNEHDTDAIHGLMLKAGLAEDTDEDVEVIDNVLSAIREQMSWTGDDFKTTVKSLKV